MSLMVDGDHLSRRVGLVVVSALHTSEEIANRLHSLEGTAVSVPSSRRGPATGRAAGEGAWEICEWGTSESDISEQIATLYSTVAPAVATLKELVSEGARVILRIILYLSPNDGYGAGFVIDKSLLKWLGDVGVEFIDVDQYILE